MMSDMYTRMTNSCHKKCIPTKYKDSEIAKGEAVCIDRWASDISWQLTQGLQYYFIALSIAIYFNY